MWLSRHTRWLRPFALRCELLKAAGAGSLTRPRLESSHLGGGRSFPQVQICSKRLVFAFLVADVLANRARSSRPYRRARNIPGAQKLCPA